MSSTNHKPQLVKSSCGLLVDPCAGTFLRPLPGAHFEFIGKLDEFRPESEGGNPLIDLAEAARRLGCERDTLYNWIYANKLRAEHGLKKIGSRWRLNWLIFYRCVEQGEFSSCS
jgi:excisionase family DNA binding protein